LDKGLKQGIDALVLAFGAEVVLDMEPKGV